MRKLPHWRALLDDRGPNKEGTLPTRAVFSLTASRSDSDAPRHASPPPRLSQCPISDQRTLMLSSENAEVALDAATRAQREQTDTSPLSQATCSATAIGTSRSRLCCKCTHCIFSYSHLMHTACNRLSAIARVSLVVRSCHLLVLMRMRFNIP